MSERNGTPGIRHFMVVTLRNGVQIRAAVRSYETSRDRISGALTALNWKLDDDPLGSSIGYIDVGEIVAVHSEREGEADHGTGTGA